MQDICCSPAENLESLLMLLRLILYVVSHAPSKQFLCTFMNISSSSYWVLSFVHPEFWLLNDIFHLGSIY